MRICIYGAGGVGGYLAGMLARKQGAAVSVIARGPHLAAMRARGLHLELDDERFTVPVRCAASPAEAGPQDFVLVTVKAHGNAAVARAIAPMLTPDTGVVFAQNGIPWWYFHKSGGALEGAHLDSVDPGGAVWRAVGPERAIGCVVWCAAHIAAPGHVRQSMAANFLLGEPAGADSVRLAALVGLLRDAGIRCRPDPGLRNPLWDKLLINVALNPLTALTRASIGDIAASPELMGFARRVADDAVAVGTALGVRFRHSGDQRLGRLGPDNPTRTSMLQDVENGRTLELEPIVGAVVELAGRLGVPCPALRLLYAQAGQMARGLGLHPAAGLSPSAARGAAPGTGCPG